MQWNCTGVHLVPLRAKGFRGVPQHRESMKARRLIESASFDPATLTVLCKAFDGAWSQIEEHFAGDDAATEHARMRLAYAVLIVAREGG